MRSRRASAATSIISGRGVISRMTSRPWRSKPIRSRPSMQRCASHSLRLLLFFDTQSEVKHALREFARSALKKVRRVVGPPPNRKKFAHDPIAGHTATLQLRSVGAARPSNEVAERLIRAYHRSSEHTPPPSFSAGEDLWTRIVNVEFAD